MSLLLLALFVTYCAWPQRPPPSREQLWLARCLTRVPSSKERPHVH